MNTAAVTPAANETTSHQPNPITDYTSFYSNLAKRLRPSAIRSLYPLASRPGMLSLFAGLPNPNVFPINHIAFRTTNGSTIEFTDNELRESMQYGPTQGSALLIEQWKSILLRAHQPLHDHNDLTVMVGHGSQDLCCKTIDCYCAAGDNVIIDTYSYPGAVQHFQTVGVNLIGIDNDQNGMITSHLRDKLHTIYSGGQTVKAMYLIPTGSNPTGVTISHQRRLEIYSLASQYNILIFEDDPYYYLSFGSITALSNSSEFIRPVAVPSFFSMDCDGRVIRFDSMSKILSAGLRIGFAVAPSAMIKPVMMMQSNTNLFAAGPSQIMIQSLLTQMGYDGFNCHVDRVALFYARRRDILYKFVRQYLIIPKLITVDIPIAGMFLWMKINPMALHINGELTFDSYDLIIKEALAVNVLMTPGKGFHYQLDAVTDYVRASFSLIPESQMEEAVKRFGRLLLNRIQEYHDINGNKISNVDVHEDEKMSNGKQ